MTSASSGRSRSASSLALRFWKAATTRVSGSMRLRLLRRRALFDGNDVDAALPERQRHDGVDDDLAAHVVCASTRSDAGVAFEGDGEDDDVGFAGGPTVQGAAHPGVGHATSHFLGGGDGALLVARADHDDLAGSGEPQRQPLSLGTCAADQSDHRFKLYVAGGSMRCQGQGGLRAGAFRARRGCKTTCLLSHPPTQRCFERMGAQPPHPQSKGAARPLHSRRECSEPSEIDTRCISSVAAGLRSPPSRADQRMRTLSGASSRA